jgi:hypothetical protein
MTEVTTQKLPIPVLHRLAEIAGIECRQRGVWDSLELAETTFLRLAGSTHDRRPEATPCPSDPATAARTLIDLMQLIAGITAQSANGFDQRLQKVAQHLRRDVDDFAENPLIWNERTGRWQRKHRKPRAKGIERPTNATSPAA